MSPEQVKEARRIIDVGGQEALIVMAINVLPKALDEIDRLRAALMQYTAVNLDSYDGGERARAALEKK